MAEEMIANLGPGVDHRVLSPGHIVMASKPPELAAIISDVVGRDEQLPAPEDAQSPLLHTNTTESNMEGLPSSPSFSSDDSRAASFRTAQSRPGHIPPTLVQARRRPRWLRATTPATRGMRRTPTAFA
jgi:hypothetical protein